MVAIKNRFTDKVIFEADVLTAKEALFKAIKADADLYGAYFRDANLRGAQNADYLIAQTRILPDGSIIGWKKCRNNVIVKLEIPAEAKRSSAFGRKCRCEYAKVLEVIGADEGISQEQSYGAIKYVKGEIVRCHEWCEDFTQECAGGIHFFITRKEAEMYG